MPTERLQKVLARAGVASRRKAEELIREGLVSVDGRRVTELGVKVDPRSQDIRVRGKAIQAEHLYYVLLHKPRGVMCTMRDPEGRPTVLDYVREVPARVVPVGRLDFHTSGVLLLSNDGEFAQGLAHEKKHAHKLYVAKVRGLVSDEDLPRWQAPLVLDGKKTRPAQVRRLRFEGDKTWLEIALAEGRNRHIHRLAEAVGSLVLRLARVAFAGLTHDGLRPGQWRYLSRDELVALKKEYGVPARVHPPPTTRVSTPPVKAGAARAPVKAGAASSPVKAGAAGAAVTPRTGKPRTGKPRTGKPRTAKPEASREREPAPSRRRGTRR
jgi:23S rRNA pseudouridine2605 synthase